jgi:outer membrane protein assembly factor BamB
MNFSRLLPLAAALTIALSGCSTFDGGGKDEKLPGKRISVLDLQKNLQPDTPVLDAEGFIAPTAWRNEFWPQAGGYPNHAMQNLVLNEGELTRIWRTSIGRGTVKTLPLTAQPIIVDGKAFTLDTDSHLSAFSLADGKRLWKTNVRAKEEDDAVIGGGVAYSKGRLYATTGYDELLSLSPADGKILWRAKLPTPSRAAPTVMEERVFVTTLDNRLIAFDVKDGRKLWEYAGISEAAGLVGGASPAASREIVVPAFSSGEVFALRIENGAVAWGDNLSNTRRAGGIEGISDIRGLPIIDNGMVIAISFGGRLAAIDERTGDRIWQKEIPGSETPWVAGNHLFVISSDNELVGLGRDDGSIRWVRQLPRFENEKSRKNPIFWTGPVYAGGRLIVAGTNGDIVEAKPEDGSIIRTWRAGGAVHISPVVAGGVMYVLTEDGELTAY